MTDSKHRSMIFGEAAQTYDMYRPDYPLEVVDHVLASTDITSAIEIGAGTGKATSRFARPGIAITCLEPSPAMAAVLRDRDLPGVDVEIISFEKWPGPDQPVDLLYAAQAWHWVDHSTGYQKAMDVLRPGGTLALIWNVPIDRYQRFVDVYRQYGPEILAENDERIGRRDSSTWLSDLARAGFADVHLMTHAWSVELGPSEFRRLCSTYSDHMMIPEPRRKILLDGLESAVVAAGGSFEVEYESRVFIGRR